MVTEPHAADVRPRLGARPEARLKVHPPTPTQLTIDLTRREPPLRVGLVAPPWVPVPPTAYGGTELVVDEIARGLQDAGHEVLLAATLDSACPVPKIGVFETAPPAMNSMAEELRHVQAAYDELDGRVDVIHDHTTIGPVWALAAGVRTPVVATAHGPISDLNRGVYAVIGQRVCLTAISRRQQQLAGDLPFRHVVHHGLDPRRFEPGPGDGGYLMFVGRMSPEKGVREAVLIAREAGLPLLVAAKMRDPYEHAYYEQEVAPVLDGSVTLLGEISPAERDGYLRRARALVNPIAWEEPFGLVMPESLALGTPVVVTPRGAAPEIVEDGVTGFVVADVAEAVAAVGRIDEIDRGACRAAVEGYFSSRRMVEEYVRVYREVLVRATAS